MSFIQLSYFVETWRRLHLTDDDLLALEQLLSKEPLAGKVIPGTGAKNIDEVISPQEAKTFRGIMRLLKESRI